MYPFDVVKQCIYDGCCVVGRSGDTRGCRGLARCRVLSIARMPCRVVLLGFDWCEKAWSYCATCWLQKFVWQ